METFQAISDAILNDPTKYTLLKRVPVFRSHVRKRKDADDVVVTEDDLYEIADTYNEACSSGSYGVILDDHRDTTLPEHAQPKVLGFARNADVGSLPNGKPCNVVDWYLRNDRADVWKDRPYRSAEYSPNRKLMHGFAMLVSKPYLDLGTMVYEDDETHSTISYRLERGESAMADEVVTKVDGGNADNAGDNANEDAMFERFAQKLFAANPWMAAVKADYESPVEEAKPTEPDTTVNNSASSAGADAVDLAYSARLASLESQLAAETTRRRETEAGAIVQRLQSVDRLILDPAIEVPRLAALSPADQVNYCAYARKVYARVPGDSPVVLYSGRVEGGEGTGETVTYSAKDEAAALNLSRRERISLEAARERVRTGKTAA